MKTEDFLDILEDRQLVSKNIVAQLRKKLSEGDSRITAKSVLKYLVKKELVTRRQAKDLLATTLSVSTKAESSILGFVPLPEQTGAGEERPQKPMIADDPPTKPRESAAKESAQKKAKKDRTKEQSRKSKKDRSAEELSPLGDSLEPMGAEEGTGDVLGDPMLGAEGADDPFTADVGDESDGSTGKKRKKKRDKKRGKSNEWDSPLLLLGGGGLIVLLIAGGLIYWLLTRENADAVLAQATSSFEGGAYAQSIESYEHFVEEFPSHPDYSQAKVRLNMAKIWKAVKSGSKYDQALETTQAALKEIEDEKSFPEDEVSKRELSSLLKDIAVGLSEQAEAAEDSEVIAQRIEQTKQALGLTNNTKFVPQSFRLGDELAVVEETLERVERRQQRDTDLTEALAKIDEAIANKDAGAAFAVRKALVQKYPVLRNEESLDAKVLEIAAAEQAAVRFVEIGEAASNEPRESAVVAELALAERQGQAKPGVEGAAVVSLDGGLYGLAASDGKLLWRRPVGLTLASTPLKIDDRIVTWDASTGDLDCYEANSGKLLWNQPLADRLASPVRLGDFVLASGAKGKLYVVRHENGELVGAVEFSQPLTSPPAVNERGDRIYLAGEHSNLYTLSSDDFSCLGVYYLGHAEDGVLTAPLPVLNKVIVAENTGAETSTLHMLGLDKQGAAVNEVATQRLRGLVTTPLLASGRRVAAVTTLGQADVYEVGAGDDAVAFTELASRDPEGGSQVARYGLVHDKHLWIGGSELLKLAIQPTGGRLPVRSLDRDYQGDVFDYPLQAIGDLLISARRPRRAAGVTIAATDAEAGTAVWETTVATPLAGAPQAESAGASLAVANASGAVYRLSNQDFAQQVQDSAVRPRGSLKAPLTTSINLGKGGLLAASADSAELVYFEGGENARPQSIELPSPLTCEPVAWHDGFALPTQVGQVFFYQSSDGREAATAFQPELAPSDSIRWQTPAVVGSGNDSRLAITDGTRKLYLLELAASPSPHLAASAAVDVGPSPLNSRLAVLGERVFAGTEAGQLTSFTLPNLEPGEPTDLGGQIVWGPYPVEDGLLMLLDTGDLVAVGSDGQNRWQQPLEKASLAGPPLSSGNEAIVALRSGRVLRLNLANGEVTAETELQRPVVAGPAIFGEQLLFATPDGTIVIVDRP